MLSKAPGILPVITIADLYAVYSDYKTSKVGCFSRYSKAIQALDVLYNTLDGDTPLNGKQLWQLVGILFQANEGKDPKTYEAFKTIKKKFGAIIEVLGKYQCPENYGMDGDLQVFYKNPGIAWSLVCALNSVNADCVRYYKRKDGAPTELRSLIYQYPQCASSLAILFSKNSKIYDLTVAIGKTREAMAVVIFRSPVSVSPISKSLTFGSSSH